MKVLGVLAAVVSAGSLAHWAMSRPTPPPPLSPPGVVYVENTIVDLGSVPLNNTVHGVFTVVNGSDHPVFSGRVVKSCACTAAEWADKELPPGGKANIRFSVRTGARRGPRAETVAAGFSSLQGGPEELVFGKVTFTPTGVFDVDPPEVALTGVSPRAEVRVVSQPTAPDQRVLRVESNNPCVKVDASRLPVVVLEIDATVASESIVNAECHVYTSVPGEEVLSVPVRVRK